MRERLLPLLFFIRLFVFLLVGFGLICIFVGSKSFRIKQIDWLEIILIASYTLLLKRVRNLVVFQHVKKFNSHSSDFEQLKNLLVIFPGYKNLTSYFLLALNKLKTPFGETLLLTGRHAKPLVTLIFGVTMLLTGTHVMPVIG